MSDLGVGVVGCGVISTTYFDNIPSFAGLRAVACTDIIPERAEARAEKYAVAAVSPDELYARSDVDIVLNITPPLVHHEVTMRALRAGKHVFSEKPLCVEPEHGPEIKAEANRRGLVVGCAPDTFLGAGGRLARELIDAGRIGRVVAGACFVMSRGMEHWHQDPRAFYIHGGGPMLDVGPYYVNTLINLLGPVASVRGMTAAAFPTRHVTAEGPLTNTHIPVETPTVVMGLLNFVSGAVVSLIASWDVWKHGHAPIELYGTDGSMRVPDPNFFDGVVEVTERNGDWQRIDSADRVFGRPNYRAPMWPASAPARANYRCLGLAEVARVVGSGGPHRASMEVGLHAVEVMRGILAAGATGGTVTIRSAPQRPAAMSEPEASVLWRGGWQ